MKVALAQLDYHIGNFEKNIEKIIRQIEHSKSEGAELLILSELAVCGYPPLDLLERRDFIEKCRAGVERIAEYCTDIGVLIGTPTLNPEEKGKMLYNSACFLYEGRIKEVFHKTLLPTYDIFDEYRYFQPNNAFKLLHYKGKKIAVTICEDLWDDQPVESEFARRRLYTVNPMEKMIASGPDFIVNIAASPFSHMRSRVKKEIFINKAIKYQLPVVYVNQVGAQTQLIFEGGSMVVDKSGTVAAQLSFFREEVKLVDLSDLNHRKAVSEQEDPERLKMVFDALVCGIKGYFQKMGFKKAVLGLSGGIDSALTLVLAVEALGKDNVHSILMPSQYSSRHSVSDSVALCDTLGSKYDIIPINEVFQAYNHSLSQIFGGLREDLTEENIQSRIRGNLLMAYSNKFGHILLNTSNKSEAAVGYGTLYGDMAGGLSVLGDVYKSDVYELARFINKEEEIIPENILLKAPSAELRPGQKDSDSLPDYDILDKVLFEYIEKQRPPEDINGFDPGLVSELVKKVNQNEYKRYQTPPILRISSKAFGEGRKIPLVARY